MKECDKGYNYKARKGQDAVESKVGSARTERTQIGGDTRHDSSGEEQAERMRAVDDLRRLARHDVHVTCTLPVTWDENDSSSLV